MSQIIGLTGSIGSGKSTFASLLCDQEASHAYYETGELIAEVAEDFNRALSGELAFETTSDSIKLVNQALIWFIDSISEKLHRDTTWSHLAVTQHGLASRPELFDKMFTYLAAVKKRPGLLDARITSENKNVYRPLLQWLGGYLIAKVGDTVWYDELFRRIAVHDSDKNLVIIGGVRFPSDAACVREHGGIIVGIERPDIAGDATDVTERSRHAIKPDITVHNNGTLKQLQQVAEQLWFDIGAGEEQQNYNAHP